MCLILSVCDSYTVFVFHNLPIFKNMFIGYFVKCLTVWVCILMFSHNYTEVRWEIWGRILGLNFLDLFVHVYGMCVMCVCVCAGMTVPKRARDSQGTISGISPHLPACLTQIPLSLPLCIHISWPASFCYCPHLSAELWNFRRVLLHQFCAFQVLGLAQQVLFQPSHLPTKLYWQHLTSIWLVTSAHREKCCQ